ncbi:MAG: hypothetical protein R3B99_24950 [Polyangiales bacterium]
MRGHARSGSLRGRGERDRRRASRARHRGGEGIRRRGRKRALPRDRGPRRGGAFARGTPRRSVASRARPRPRRGLRRAGPGADRDRRTRVTWARSRDELARSVETMERVLEARVHVALPDTRRIALDEARPRPRASVLVRHRGDAVDENAVRALVAGAVQDMTPEDVAVVQVQANVEVPAREANLVRFGPIAVTRGTAGALKGVLAGALGLHLVLAVLVVIGWRRRKLSVPEAPAT